jgi:hypothetical protein
MEEEHNGASEQQRRSPERGRGGSKRKSGNGRGDASAAAAGEMAGNNTSPPAMSVKAERVARGAGGKKSLHTNTSANPSLSSWAPVQRRGSRSRSPHAGRLAPGTSDRHHDTAKKRPMRPIEDVLSRLRHELGSGCGTAEGAKEALVPFSVAYVDRVWGDQEVSFTEFFESEDTKDVPLHRITVSYLAARTDTRHTGCCLMRMSHCVMAILLPVVLLVHALLRRDHLESRCAF